MKDQRKSLTDALIRQRGNPLAGTPLAGTPLAGTPLAGTPLAGISLGGTPPAGNPLAGTPLANLLASQSQGGAQAPGIPGGFLGGGLDPNTLAARMPGFIDQAAQMLQGGKTGIAGLLSLFAPGMNFTAGNAAPAGSPVSRATPNPAQQNGPFGFRQAFAPGAGIVTHAPPRGKTVKL